MPLVATVTGGVRSPEVTSVVADSPMDKWLICAYEAVLKVSRCATRKIPSEAGLQTSARIPKGGLYALGVDID